MNLGFTTGDLRPVRWGSYLGAVSAYQGVIEGKSAIHDAFWKKADAVSRDPSIVAQQDWADLRAVIDCVRFAFVDT